MAQTPEQRVNTLSRQNGTLRQELRDRDGAEVLRLNQARRESQDQGLSRGRRQGGMGAVATGIGGFILGAALVGSGVLGKDGPNPTFTPSPSPRPTPGLTEAPGTTVPGTETPSAEPTEASESQAPVTGEWVAVPATLKEIKVMGLQGGSTAEDGTVFPQFEEGKWFHPLYDRFQVDPSKDQWRGVGPWYPVEFRNLDANAALFSTHGNVGELIVVSDQGGWVEVGFWQLDNYQDDGSWGRGPDGVGDIYQDGSWAMQYTFKELGANAEVQVIDPDTGNPYTWEDGSPVIYRANDKGTASFEIPQTNGNDVRVAFRFQMPGASNTVQPHEVKIERGPNDRPRRTGENLLPESVLKPEVPLE